MPKSDDDFRDPAAERAVLGGISQYGGDAFVDVADFIDTNCFVDTGNSAIFKCFEHFFTSHGYDKKLDVPSILSSARSLNLGHIVDTPESIKHLRALYNLPIEKETVRREAKKLYKLAIAYELDQIIANMRRDFRKVKGDESLNEILALAETPIFDFTAKLNQAGTDGPTHIATGIDAFLKNLEDNPRDNIGISSGFAKYDWCIGGGFRRSTVNIVGARAKAGKTFFCDNVALHVAGNLNIPVLNLDTEMTREEHLARILAHIVGKQTEGKVLLTIREIEQGTYAKDNVKREAIHRAAEWLKTIPYDYESVMDKSFEEHVATMRRWVVKRVGTDKAGRTKDAIILYDYLQLTDPGEFSGDFKEYQILGFQMLALLRMAAKCDVPIFSLLQLNRDGIDKETAGVAAGSDRIIWKAANFTILKKKSEEEIAEDGFEEGLLKLVTVVARHGEGLSQGDYINLKFNGATATMIEGKTRNEVSKAKRFEQKGFQSNDKGEIIV
jgi:replicative DNA helicase